MKKLIMLKTNSEVLSKLKKRRLGFELVKIMQTEKSWIAMQFLADNGQLKFISQDLADMNDTKQRCKNHKQSNVWKHTLAALKNAASTDAIVNLAILFHDVGKNKTATDNNTQFPGHDKTGAQITTNTLTELGLPKGTVKRVANMVENHLFMVKVGPKGDEADYKRLILTLIGDLNRFFTLTEADAKAHKEYNASWLEIVKKRIDKIKASKPEKTGTEELKKSQEILLNESISILLSQESEIEYIDEMLETVGIDG